MSKNGQIIKWSSFIIHSSLFITTVLHLSLYHLFIEGNLFLKSSQNPVLQFSHWSLFFGFYWFIFLIFLSYFLAILKSIQESKTMVKSISQFLAGEPIANLSLTISIYFSYKHIIHFTNYIFSVSKKRIAILTLLLTMKIWNVLVFFDFFLSIHLI